MAEQATGAYLRLVGWRGAGGRYTKMESTAVARLNDALKGLLNESRDLAERESPRSQRTTSAQRAQSARRRRSSNTRATRQQRATGAQKSFSESWTVEFEQTSKGGTGFLVNTAPYATYVMFPTKPHRIEAKQAKALRWEAADGVVHFAKSVQHPGTKGNDITGRVMKTLRPKFETEGHKVAVQAAAAFVDAYRGG